MKNKWFHDVFLASLYSRWNENKKPFWLSQKQTTICVQNMAREVVTFQNEIGENFHHDNYICDFSIDGKDYTAFLYYSKKNGCGSLDFLYHMTEAEKARWEKIEKISDIIRDITRSKKGFGRCLNIEKHESYVAKLKENISYILEDIAEDEAENDVEMLHGDLQLLQMYKTKLSIAEQVMEKICDVTRIDCYELAGKLVDEIVF